MSKALSILDQAASHGKKYDQGRPQPDLILRDMSRAILAVAEVATFGAGKYTAGGWPYVDDAINRYRNAKQRHMLIGAIEDRDEESGLLHAAHEAWNALAVLELTLRQQGEQFDKDRLESVNKTEEWDESRIDIVGQNGNDGEHYPKIGDYLPEYGGYLVGFINGDGIIMPADQGINTNYSQAASFLADLKKRSGYADWRIPEIKILEVVWGNIDKLYELDLLHDFYWSSSWLTNNDVWAQDFSDGHQSPRDASGEYIVRPVRTVKIEQLVSAAKE